MSTVEKETQAVARTGDKHWLTPLLRPESIAYVGASTRVGSPGNRIVGVPKEGGFAGRMYPVNPSYEEVEGLTCYPSMADLPEVPDMVVLAVADHRLEAALGDVISSGARSAVIFGGANLIEPGEVKLPQRMRAMAREAGLPVCGGNCMGFYNLDHDLLATFASAPYPTRRGGVSLISHSGSSWSALSLNDGRLGFNLTVSSGQELTVSVSDYLDYAVEQSTTDVVGLILETIRDPDGFITALEKANAAQVPVVALKVGASERSAELAISHSGAIAGDDAAYEAVFERYGVSRVHTLEQLGAAFVMLTQPHPAAAGGLAAIHDSGFERELIIDRAEAVDVPLAEISSATSNRLAELLDPGLEPVNPLDAWGTGREYRQVFIDCFDTLLADDNVALGVVSHNARDQSWITDAWVDTCLEGHHRHDKPIALVTSFPWTRHAELARRLTEAGVGVIEGMDNGLYAARIAMEQRDFANRTPSTTPAGVDDAVRTHWRGRLDSGEVLSETQSLALLADYGIATALPREASDETSAIALARELARPVVMKTAMPGIHHKTEVDGVHLDLAGEDDVRRVYQDLATRLGPVVSIAPMVKTGVEMSLGVVSDPQFGPLVMIGAGGVLIELMGDRRLALPPFDTAGALALIDELRIRRMLDGFRGAPAADVQSLAHTASRLSVLAFDLGEHLAELDINPVIVSDEGAVAVDALVVSRKR